jgi:photosystem II stability/assembly factor-like uncharacterized protein
MRAVAVIIFLTTGFAPLSAQDFWVPTNGPYGGVVFSILPDSNNVVYVGTYGGGVFQSADNGHSWIQRGLDGQIVSSIVRDSQGNLFAGTYDKGVMRSSDQGNTWFPANSGMPVPPPMVFSTATGLGVDLYAGTMAGMYRSADQGVSWTQLFDQPVAAITIAPNGSLFIASDGVYRSTDNGQSWTLRLSSNVGVSMLRSNPQGDIFVGFLATGFTDVSPGLIRSTDNGNTWEQINTGLTTRQVRSLAFRDPDELFLGTSDGVFVSMTDGDSWAPAGLSGKGINAIGVLVDGTLLAGTAGGGIFRLLPNDTMWEQQFSGLKSTIVRSIAVDMNDNIFAGTSSDGIYRSADQGQSWTQKSSGLTNNKVWSLLSNGGELLAGTNQGIFRSRNNGDSWSPVFASQMYPEVRTLLSYPGDLLFAGAGLSISGDIALWNGTVFRSSDGGDTWEKVSTGLPNKYVYRVVRDSSNDLYVALFDSGVYRSTNLGIEWQKTALNTYGVFSLVVTRSNALIAGASGGSVFRSTNHGQTWQLLTGVLSNKVAYALNMSSTGQIFCTTSSAEVFCSTDDGITWQSVTSGLPGTVVWTIGFDSRHYAFAGTNGLGVYKSSSPITSVVPDPTNPAIRDFALSQNYPNPFNNGTVIQFFSPNTQTIRLEVFNVLGQKVASLLDGVVGPGEHRVFFNANDLSSGIFFYRLRAARNLLTKRMLLLK